MTNPNTLGDIIRKIAQDHGEQALLDSQFTLAVFMDLAPNLKKEKELLRSFLLCNGAEKFIRMRLESKQNQEACIYSIVKDLEENQWLSRNAACYVCSEFYLGLTGQKWEFVQTNIDNLDVYRSITISNTERFLGKNISIEVDGNKVVIPLPANVSDGQTVHFPQKGRKDLATGMTGDLYVTIHVTVESSRKKGSILGISVAAIVLIFVILISLGKGGQGTTKTQNNSAYPGKSQANSHTHSWQNATCSTPKICTICGETVGSEIGHQWADATYAAPQTCTVCGTTTGSKLRVEPVYLNELSYFNKYGKVYYHDNQNANYENNEDWRDLNTPGHIKQQVCDNHGNVFTYGIHMDGDQLGPYFITYDLGGKYTTFSGWCVLPDYKAGSSDSKNYSKYFEIYCDGRLVFTSNTMKNGSISQYFEIDITDIEVLTIQYPPTTGPNDLAVLCDGRIE